MDNDIMNEISSSYRDRNSTAEGTAALYGKLEDPNFQYLSYPVLIYAAEHADAAGIEALLAAGADAAYQSEYNYNALHRMAYKNTSDYAYWADEKKAAELLLNAGTSVLRKDVDGVTPTYIAAERGKYKMLEAIKEAGKKMDFPGKNGESPLHIACDRAVRSAESFYKYTKPRYDEAMAKESDGNEFNDRMLADRQKSAQEQYDRDWEEVERYFKTIQLLLDAGLDPDQKNNYGTTPKEIAFECRDIRVPALLAGTYTEGAENDENTRLEMLAKGMNLMQAVEKRDHEAVEALLKLGADPNEFYGEELRHVSIPLMGKVPLSLACVLLDTRLIGLLLDHGANPVLKDSEGKIPLMYCFSVGVGVNHTTFQNKVIETIMKAMTDKGLTVNGEADDGGNTLLNTVCRRVDRATGYNSNTLEGTFIRELLRYKADPNIPNNAGQTPLMWVCQGGSGYMEDIQISLLEAGADVAARDKEGNTPLIYAAQNRNKTMAKTMSEMLFEFGDPKPDTVNNDGKSALAFATEQDNEPLVNFLLTKV
ncbi:ankyrin repeat domain-containing protein [Breznakiella homolactica]|uniref:Ankyrin repeat domain-containing protein n=1 Tax=Breznakiella homolactica TaxID=2798577 RepID=A0A7T7XM20_9SPIR|nr:ankyrin repeat domain-containing protein [Breznakiella homolactica]QQO08786.1 ankyrin repeat domain-containing protein [Breznakiella homolactica]